jgi:hypothetical protein
MGSKTGPSYVAEFGAAPLWKLPRGTRREFSQAVTEYRELYGSGKPREKSRGKAVDGTVTSQGALDASLSQWSVQSQSELTQ